MAWGCAARLQAVRDCQHRYGASSGPWGGGGQTDELQEGTHGRTTSCEGGNNRVQECPGKGSRVTDVASIRSAALGSAELLGTGLHWECSTPGPSA